METFIDGIILSDFFENRPQRTPIGNEYDNERWDSFWKFLKSETDLQINNPNKLSNNHKLFYSSLTTGRGETKISTTEKAFDSVYKNKIKSKSPFSFFCINEDNEQQQKKYNSKNGYLIGFLKDYISKWERLKLLQLSKVLPVRKNIEGALFSKWEILGEYLTPFTDAVLVDNYIFSDESLILSNFEQILIQLDCATPVKYNLTIVTFEGNKIKLNGPLLFKQLHDIKIKNQLKCDIGLVLATRKVKEHDRGIFTNYLRIMTGDTFNYFNSRNAIITGTDISFHSLANPDNMHAARAALSSVKNNSINHIVQNFKDTHVFGNLKNQLLII